jgi:hypothetical protein
VEANMYSICSSFVNTCIVVGDPVIKRGRIPLTRLT